jgi:hypothetical protein
VARKRAIREADLRNWKLIEPFLELLPALSAKAPRHPSFGDPRRTLGYASYLCLFLFGLFNSVVTSMRGLCAITELKKVRRVTGCPTVSLGSFSEIQHLIDPDLLKLVFEQLVERVGLSPRADPRLGHLQLMAQDGSLWRALPRMAWAQYGVGPKGQARGVRLHLRFNILKECPEEATLTPGKGSETHQLREMLLPGQTTVADRLYGKDYRLFEDIARARAFFVFRLAEVAVISVQEQLPITEADRAVGVVRHAWVRLGATEKLRSMVVRLVEVQHEGHHLLLVTNLPVEELSAELVAVVYRRRWTIELFFRWIKCTLGYRHFLAESPRGVAIGTYLALIAAVLLQLFTGQRPNKRVMELLQMYLHGWASAEEAAELIHKYSAKGQRAKRA